MKKVGNLDLITIGRSSVDLYGSQIGGRLEDMRSFQKYVGGSPTNVAFSNKSKAFSFKLFNILTGFSFARSIRCCLIIISRINEASFSLSN